MSKAGFGIILTVLAILALIIYYIYPYWEPYFLIAKREKYYLEAKRKVDLYNKTGDKNILEQIYKNFHNEDWYFKVQSVKCLSDINESRMNVEIEIKLVNLYYEPLSDNALKAQVLNTLLHFNLKSKEALDLLVSCLDDWNTYSAEFVAKYMVKQKTIFEDVVLSSYKKNVADNPKNLVTDDVYNIFYADERYKALFNSNNLQPPKLKKQ